MNTENNDSFLTPYQAQNQVSTRDTETAAVTAAAVAEVQAAYAIAIRFPRNLEQVRSRMLEAARRPGFQKAARYAKPVGTGKVEGWSIRAAEEFIRDMGNLRVTTATTYESESERKVRVQVTDLETNASFGRELTIQKSVERKGDKVARERAQDIISQRKNSYGETVYVVRATEDELQQKESSAISKVLRNEGLRLIPGDLLEEAFDVINGVKEQGKKMTASKEEARKIVDAFSTRGVTVKEIEEYLGCPVAQVTVADISDLREIWVAITSEGARWAEYLEGKRQERTKTAGSTTGTAKEAPTRTDDGGLPLQRTRQTKRQELAKAALEAGIDVKVNMTAEQIEAALELKRLKDAKQAEPIEAEELPYTETETKSEENSFLA